MNNLARFFADGDADLRATAGEDAELVRKLDGERTRVRAVISPLAVSYTLQRVTGPVVRCEREAIISRAEVGRAPVVGDMLHAGGAVYEIVTVTGWAYDTSWHCDLAVRKGKR